MQNLKFRTKLNFHSFCYVMDSPNCKIFLNFSNTSSKMQHTAEPGVAQHMRYTKSTNFLKIFPLILIPELPQKLSDPPKYAIFFHFWQTLTPKLKIFNEIWCFRWNLMVKMTYLGGRLQGVQIWALTASFLCELFDIKVNKILLVADNRQFLADFWKNSKCNNFWTIQRMKLKISG